MADDLLPARETRVDIEVKKSRFIATLAPTLTVDEAKVFVQRIKSEFRDATHNVPAFVVGHGSRVIAHCHDDGEPSGTAGRPALAVLQGSGWGDVAVVVTRYYGGLKLGTGGLVRAYGDAVRAALAATPAARKVATHTLLLTTPYAYLEQMRRLVLAHDGLILEETFGAAVDMSVRLEVDRLVVLETAVREMTHGSLRVEVLATNEATIMPIE